MGRAIFKVVSQYRRHDSWIFDRYIGGDAQQTEGTNTMSTPRFKMKPLTAILVGGGMLASTPSAMASFIGDQIDVTFRVTGATYNQTLTDTFTAQVPGSSGAGGSFGGMALTSPLSGAYNGAMQQASGAVTYDLFFNFGVYNAPEDLAVTLTLSDIDWLPAGTITGYTDYTGPLTVTTGPDFVQISGSVAAGGELRGSGLLNLVAEQNVPEPTTLALLGAGVAAFASVPRRRKRKP